ncbi:MAG: MBL fold metallo-hydrolase [Gammaproteobacteria bacterium]|jgi:glyoxylase-like metal-dependent hydrolase (beta-lactamase superfamily II)|nr:MBL fold metallo-hydrolase [Gammaproteobacteria bacterium]
MSVKIPFNFKYDFEYCKSEQLTPLIRRVTARNSSGFTYNGTGTYIVGQGRVAVIDPGPLLEEHIDALKDALEGEEVSHIFVTHTHGDHSPAAEPLKAFWDARTYAYGPHGAGKLEQGIAVEVGGDRDFEPDVRVKHGEVLEGDGWTIECVYTPGHTSNHLCFALAEENAIFTGDHIMGWATSVIAPPDGDMTQYLDSLNLLLQRDETIYWPSHGPCIKDVKTYVQAYIDHRLDRERQIIDVMTQGYSVIKDMVPVMYADTDPVMYTAAGWSVLAAMLRLIDSGQVTCSGNPTLSSEFKLADQ